jgi:hypothetical protein
MTTATLDAFLGSYAEHDDPLRVSVSALLRQLALTAVKIRSVINQGALGKAFSGGLATGMPTAIRRRHSTYLLTTCFSKRHGRLLLPSTARRS